MLPALQTSQRVSHWSIFSGDVERIINYVLYGDGRHASYNLLASITDDYGHRMTGSQALEDVIGI